jgi:organic hydroperoxide reductase OsmC/OhrA
MLWYLHLCAEAGVIVVDYSDNATGVMAELPDGSGRFTEVTLHPLVTVASSEMEADANALHVKANSMCFIANSVNFPVHHQPKCVVAAKK